MGRCYFGLRQFSEARNEYLDSLELVRDFETSAYKRLQSQVIECEVEQGNISRAFELLDDLKNRLAQQAAPSSLSQIDEPLNRIAGTELEYVECINRKIELIYKQRDEKMPVPEKAPSETATFGKLTGFTLR